MTTRSVRRRVLTAALLLGVPSVLPIAVRAQEAYPARPLRMIVPYPSGGAIDTIARTVAEQLSRQMGQPVLVDNRPGAGGRVATEILARAQADGHTMLITTAAPISVAPALTNKLPYAVEKDLLPVARVAEIINVMLVNPASGVGSVAEFVEWARRKGGPIRYGSAGVGSADHLAGELFQSLTGLPMLHVPYKGGGAALVDLSSGVIDVGFSTYVVASPLITSKKINVIAVTTGERQALLSNLQTVAETVPGFSISNWAGVFVPKETPIAAARRLYTELGKAVSVAGVREKLNAAAIETVFSKSMDEFTSFVRDDTRQWARIVKQAGVPMEQ